MITPFLIALLISLGILSSDTTIDNLEQDQTEQINEIIINDEIEF